MSITINEFAAQIKEKHPVYSGMDNLDLATRMLQKYPQYNSLVAQNPAPKGPEEAPLPERAPLPSGQLYDAQNNGYAPYNGPAQQTAAPVAPASAPPPPDRPGFMPGIINASKELWRQGGQTVKDVDEVNNVPEKILRGLGGVVSGAYNFPLNVLSSIPTYGPKEENKQFGIPKYGHLEEDTQPPNDLPGRTLGNITQPISDIWNKIPERAQKDIVAGGNVALAALPLASAELKGSTSTLDVLGKGIKNGIKNTIDDIKGPLPSGIFDKTGKIQSVQPPPVTAQDFSQAVRQGVDRGIRPSNIGSTANQREAYYGKTENAVQTIAGNKNNLNLLDYNGNPIDKIKSTDAQGNPIEVSRPIKTNVEFSQAISQTKPEIYKQFHDMATQAGDEGVAVNTQPALDKLAEYEKGKNYKMNPPEVREYATKQKAAIAELNGEPPEVVEARIADLNNSLPAYYSGKGIKNLGQARVDASIASILREQLDKSIESVQGPGYQDLKNQYGALSHIEKDINKQAVRSLQKSSPGLFSGLTDVYTGSELAMGAVGALMGHPGAILSLAKGASGLGIKTVIKELNRPDRYIEKMFDKAWKYSPEKEGIGPEPGPTGGAQGGAGAGPTGGTQGGTGPNTNPGAGPTGGAGGGPQPNAGGPGTAGPGFATKGQAKYAPDGQAIPPEKINPSLKQKMEDEKKISELKQKVQGAPPPGIPPMLPVDPVEGAKIVKNFTAAKAEYTGGTPGVLGKTDPYHSITIKSGPAAGYTIEARNSQELNSRYQAKLKDIQNLKAQKNQPSGAIGGGKSIGSEAQVAQQKTPQFKTFFGDWEKSPETASKVVHENGQPKIVTNGRTMPDVPKSGEFPKAERGRILGHSFWTDNPEVSDGYAVYGAPLRDLQYHKPSFQSNVTPAYLNIRNPITEKTSLSDMFKGDINNLTNALTDKEGLAQRAKDYQKSIDYFYKKKHPTYDQERLDKIPTGQKEEDLRFRGLAIKTLKQQEKDIRDIVYDMKTYPKSKDDWGTINKVLQTHGFASGPDFAGSSLPEHLRPLMGLMEKSPGLERYIKKNYDGFGFEDHEVHNTMGVKSHTYIPFSENQIKSAIANNGSFNPGIKSILRSAPAMAAATGGTALAVGKGVSTLGKMINNKRQNDTRPPLDSFWR